MLDLLKLFCMLHLVILIHELGHYATCKLLGIGVEEVSIGFGFTVFKINSFSWRLMPLGGYTVPQYKDNLGFRPLQPADFCSRQRWQKLTVILSGVCVNLIVALIAWTVFEYDHFAWLNLIMALFQFIPAKGTDGYEALRVLKS